MNGTRTLSKNVLLTDLAREIHLLAHEAWGQDRAILLIGQHRHFVDALDRLARIAVADAPVLITGETGTGKELFARALFLLARNHRRAFMAVNCSQYTNDHVMASELFGHRKGSFTGATAEHRGVFEDADSGTILLDEIAELSPVAQAMLLRVLDAGEVLPVGATRPKHVNVRVVAATNRDLLAMIRKGAFREDLYYRLQRLKLRVPPLRERGRDWALIADYFLDRLTQCPQMPRQPKRLAPTAVARLDRYAWPGNVRELRGCIETGFYMSRGSQIMLDDIAEGLETPSGNWQSDRVPFFVASEHCARMEQGEVDFWDSIYAPFMMRDLNRNQVRDVIAEGLARSNDSYKRLLPAFRIDESDYLRFHGFPTPPSSQA